MKQLRSEHEIEVHDANRGDIITRVHDTIRLMAAEKLIFINPITHYRFVKEFELAEISHATEKRKDGNDDAINAFEYGVQMFLDHLVNTNKL